MEQNQYQSVNPLVFFPPFPPFPIIPHQVPFCSGVDNDVINIGGSIGGNPSPVRVTQVTTETYEALSTDYMLCVETTNNAVSITLPTGILGTVYVIKDCDGNADNNNITIDGTGQNVDGGTGTIDSPYGSVTVIFNGSHWSIV